MSRVQACALPPHCALNGWLAAGDFRDAYRAAVADPQADVVAVFVRATTATPRWVSALMTARNALVRPFGLKDVGSMRPVSGPAADCAAGDRLGIFSVLSRSPDELLLGIDDRHLDVRVSVMRVAHEGAPQCVVATGVKVHNALGHAYMLPVARIHPFVVRAVMRRVAA